jgi:orotidine-5'-phosphate decarboxylase
MTAGVSAPSPLSAVAERDLTYLDRLAARVETVGNFLCVGVDPDPDALPEGLSRDVAGVEMFARQVIEASVDRAAAIKINLAFFEAFGSSGLAALERVRAAIPPGVPFIADAKRGDIGTTVARQAVALYDALGADAVTASPYLGGEAIKPLLARPDRFVYVLCRTSNPGAHELQNLNVDGDPLYVHVARHAGEWAGTAANVGLVVGATAPAELAEIRAAAPQLPFLVPGIGAQGGDLDAVRAHGPALAGPAANVRGGSLLVNVSRGISSSATERAGVEAAIRGSVDRWATLLQC